MQQGFQYLAAVVVGSLAYCAGLQALAQTDPARQAAQQQPFNDNTILISWLRGLRFVDKPSKIDKNGFDRAGVIVDGPDILYSPGVYQQLQGFLGKPLKQGDLQRIVKTVSDWYAARNHPYIDVSFPEQDAGNGIVQVLVTEFRAGQIKVEGNDWFAASEIRSAIRLKPGERINAESLNSDLTYLNESDFRDVRIVLQKSTTPGETDLVVQTGDRLPLRATVAYANNGTPASGRDRWTTGITWGNAFWLDQTLTYQFTSSGNYWFYPKDIFVSPNDANFVGQSASYTIPLPWRDRLIFFGSYDEVRPALGPFLGDLGVSWQLSMRYAMPIAVRNWPLQELQFGYDFKRSNNNLQFGGTVISNSLTDIDQFVLTYGTVINDSLGQTKFSNRLVFSPGQFSPYNNDAAFQPSATHNGVAFAKAFYVYNDISAVRLTKLPLDMGWVSRLEAQFSTANLLASERMGAGGVETVRGYDEYAASGSEGYLISQELRSPDFAPLGLIFGKDTAKDQMQFSLFWDFAYVRDRKFVPGTGGSYLESAGAGVQYALDRYISIGFDYGYQLRLAPGAKKHEGQFDLSVSVSN